MDSKRLSLIAMLAAVYALASFLPGFPMIGVPGSKIDLTRALEMSFGFLLGPFVGPLTSFLGAFVGKTITGGGTSLLFTPLALISTFTAACLARDKVLNVKGWILGALIIIVMIMGWYVTPVGFSILYYPLPHIISLCIVLIFRGRIQEYLNSKQRSKIVVGALLASYPSTMAGHMAGNIIFIVFFNPTAAFFVSLLPISIIERLTITALSTFIAAPILLATREIFPDLFK